jgi:hypothetical protein
MARSRRADAVVFGFDFQVNSAIVLFLENIKEVEKLRLEGNYEDIELELSSGEMILAQAKAVEKASADFTNVRKNMKKALMSLAEGGEKINAKELIVITNSPNPFNDDKSRSAFYGHAHRKYDTLPPSAQKIVDEYLSKMDNILDTDKLKIQVLPFEPDDEAERYKVIMENINAFVGNLNTNISGIGQKLLETWHWQVFDNGGKKDSAIKLSKKDIIWPVLVKITEIEQCEDSFLEQFDSGVYEEVINRYAEIINSHCEQCEFFIKILSDYNGFKTTKKAGEKLNDFIELRWKDYVSEFNVDGIDEGIQEAITKIIIHNIIKRRFTIDRIKKEVNLC